MVQIRAQFKLDVRSQKAQGIYKNTSNSLTGASAASAGAIHYTTTNEPMVLAGPRRYVSKHTKHTKHGKGVHKANLRGIALGYKPNGSKGLKAIKHKKVHRKKAGGKHSYSSHGVRYHKHKHGVKRKSSAYCQRPYAAKRLGA